MTPATLLDACQSINIASADDFRRGLPAMEQALAHLRLARLAGALHQIAELIAQEPLLCGAQLDLFRNASTTGFSGRLSLRARATNGYELDAASGPHLFQIPAVGNSGSDEARAAFPHECRCKIARLQDVAEALWAPALQLLSTQELEAARRSSSEPLRLALGPTAADIARQWGFDWLAAEVERMLLAETASRPASPDTPSPAGAYERQRPKEGSTSAQPPAEPKRRL